MANSNITYTADGAATEFAVPFPYIQKSHVKVYVNSVLKADLTDYYWLNATTVKFYVAPANGLAVFIQRSTSPTVKLVTFQDAATLPAATLNKAFDQEFYLAQEAVDSLEGAMILGTDDKFDALSKIIKNVANPVANGDAVNLLTLLSYYVGSASPTAANIANVPAGSIAASDVQAALNELDTEKQAITAVLTDLISRWVAASASGPASLAFHEDTDNGTNKVTVAAPAALAADVAVTLPDTAGTVAILEKAQVFTKQQTPLKGALTHASPTTWDCAAAQVATWTITGSVTLSAATNQVAGTFYTLVVTQDGTGGRVITWDASYKFADGIDEVVAADANAVSILTFYSNGTNMYCVGAAKNLS